MQSISLITLGVRDLSVSNRFYQEGFGWAPVFATPEIVFYAMNGFLFSTYLVEALRHDSQRGSFGSPGAFSLAHNVRTREAVEPAMARLLAAGGTLVRAADEPPHGGLRGYVADPDDHAWEIAWQPTFVISAEGHVAFAAP